MVGPDYPLTVSLKLSRPGEPSVDRYGNPTPGGWETEQVLVFAVVEGGEDTPLAAQPDRVRYDLTVYAPADLEITTSDRIEWAGGTYEVVGPPGNWDANPWWEPGLTRVYANLIEGAGHENQMEP